VSCVRLVFRRNPWLVFRRRKKHTPIRPAIATKPATIPPASARLFNDDPPPPPPVGSAVGGAVIVSVTVTYVTRAGIPLKGALDVLLATGVIVVNLVVVVINLVTVPVYLVTEAVALFLVSSVDVTVHPVVTPLSFSFNFGNVSNPAASLMR